MEPFIRRFVRASLVWFGVGVLIGISMAFFPREALVYRTAHIHANLLGFVSMMIYGVAYHVMPRFSGNPLHSRREAAVHLWVANAGLALLVVGWIGRVWVAAPADIALRTGAAASAVGAGLFIHNIWKTLGGDRRLSAHVARPAAPTIVRGDRQPA